MLKLRNMCSRSKYITRFSFVWGIIAVNIIIYNLLQAIYYYVSHVYSCLDHSVENTVRKRVGWVHMCMPVYSFCFIHTNVVFPSQFECNNEYAQYLQSRYNEYIINTHYLVTYPITAIIGRTVLKNFAYWLNQIFTFLSPKNKYIFSYNSYKIKFFV